MVAVVGYVILQGWFAATVPLFGNPQRNFRLIVYYVTVCWLIYDVYTTVCIWRCAPNTSYRFFATLARLIVVVTVSWCVFAVIIMWIRIHET